MLFAQRQRFSLIFGLYKYSSKGSMPIMNLFWHTFDFLTLFNESCNECCHYQIVTYETIMVSITPKLAQVKAIAAMRMTKLAARVIVVLIVLYYGTLLDVLSGTKED
jgi:hypothetical protein